jgi:hypothetical protein
VTAEAKQQAATLLTENPALGNAMAILKQASGKVDGKQQWQALENKVGKYRPTSACTRPAWWRTRCGNCWAANLPCSSRTCRSAAR